MFIQFLCGHTLWIWAMFPTFRSYILPPSSVSKCEGYMSFFVYIVTRRPIATKRVDIPVSVEIDSWKLTRYGTHSRGYEWSTNISLDTDTLYKRPFRWAWCQSCVEAGSNTSTVALRVVGGDKKGSLESETVKYGRCAGEGQQQL
jgi:hypothetical protein